MANKTGDTLLQLGITPDLKGFQYIIDMVELINGGDKSGTINQYKIIAEKRNTTYTRVERRVRHAMEELKPKSKEYERIIGTNAVLNNSRFLYTLAYRLKEE